MLRLIRMKLEKRGGGGGECFHVQIKSTELGVRWEIVKRKAYHGNKDKNNVFSVEYTWMVSNQVL